MEVPTENLTDMSEVSESQAMRLSNLVLTDHDYTSQVIYEGGSFSFKVWIILVRECNHHNNYSSIMVP